MVTKFVPSPANSRGKLRSLAIARRLAKVSDELVLGAASPTPRVTPTRFRDRHRRPHRSWHPDLQHVVAASRAPTPDLRDGSGTRGSQPSSMRRLAEKPTDLLQVEYCQLASYLVARSARRKVLDFHNIESSLATSFAKSSKTLKGRLAYVEAPLLRRRERLGAEQADLVTVVSTKDADRMPGRPRELLVCPNGWEPTEQLPPSVEPTAIFVALMGWKPNVDAAVWLGRDVWPLVRARMPASPVAAGRSRARPRRSGRSPPTTSRSPARSRTSGPISLGHAWPWRRSVRWRYPPQGPGGAGRRHADRVDDRSGSRGSRT